MTPSEAACDSLVKALVKAACDSDDSVARSARASLVRLGAAAPASVLPELLTSLRDAWLSSGQRVSILRAAASAAHEAYVPGAMAALAEELIEPAIEERLRAPDPEAAEAAGELVSEIGRSAPGVTLNALEFRCPAEVLPAAGILRSLGDLAGLSPAIVVPSLTATLLPKLVPLASEAQGENRAALAYAFHQAAQAIVQHATSAEAVAEAGNLLLPLLEPLLSDWISSRSEAVRQASAEALASIVQLLSPAVLSSLLHRLMPTLLSAHKREREWDRLPITAALWAVLDHAARCDLGRRLHSEQLLLPTLHAMHEGICTPLDRSSSDCLRNHNEELRCAEALATLGIEPTLTFLLSQLEAKALGMEPDPSTLCGTLEILRHLVQRLGDALDGPRVATILSAAVGLLSAPAYRVRLSITQLIGALATRGYLLGEGGLPLLLFLIRQAAVAPEETDLSRRRSAETVGALETKEVPFPQPLAPQPVPQPASCSTARSTAPRCCSYRRAAARFPPSPRPRCHSSALPRPARAALPPTSGS